MQKQIIQIENIEAGELLNRFDKLESAITALTNQPQNAVNESISEYITRHEVAKILKISLVTVNDWTRKGILIAYKAGNRVYFKRKEVSNALIKVGGRYVQ